MAKEPYHSALHPVARATCRTSYHEGRFGTSFVWDVGRNGLPDMMVRGADVLYGDPPWKDGYDKFAARAGTAQSVTWRVFIGNLGIGIRASRLPAVMVAGKQAMAWLRPDRFVPCRLNGGDAMAASWGPIELEEGLDAVDILKGLAVRFNVVGDPFCGYGRAGRIFAGVGKRYIMSDLSAECIGHISENEGSWR